MAAIINGGDIKDSDVVDKAGGPMQVRHRGDEWIEIDSETDVGSRTPIKLRPGCAARVSLQFGDSAVYEVEIRNLRSALDEIEKEHAR